MIGATYLKVQRTASTLRVKNGDIDRLIGRIKSRMNTKLHANAATNGRPLGFFVTAGQVKDYAGGAALLDDLQKGNGEAISISTRALLPWRSEPWVVEKGKVRVE